MRELFTMWRESRMIMLVAVTAAVYAALLIPFGGFVIIPGITNVRPGNVIPVVFSLLFGPAAAWGSAIGNLINDIFVGTFGPGSIFGFIGNFFFGMIGYKLWGNLGILSSRVEPDMRSAKQIVEFALIALVASALCAAIIAWGLELLGLFPFSLLGTIIFLNNTIAVLILGPPILYLIYPRVRDMGLLYTDIMREEDLPEVSGPRMQMAAMGIAAIAVVWLVVGLAISFGIHEIEFGITMEEGFGEGGFLSQILLGAVAFVVVLALTAISGERLSKIVP